MLFLSPPPPPASGSPGRFVRWWARRLVRRALRLAGDPALVFDLPCGAGALWAVLAEHPYRVILAADSSADVLALALAMPVAAAIGRRLQVFQTSLFAIELSQNAVDCILCLGLLHRLAGGAQRVAVLRELHRVTRDTLIASLWVDGNYQAWRHRRTRHTAMAGSGTGDTVARAVVEAEFRQVGFRILASLGCFPGYSMERLYVLRKND